MQKRIIDTRMFKDVSAASSSLDMGIIEEIKGDNPLLHDKPLYRVYFAKSDESGHRVPCHASIVFYKTEQAAYNQIKRMADSVATRDKLLAHPLYKA